MGCGLAWDRAFRKYQLWQDWDFWINWDWDGLGFGIGSTAISAPALLKNLTIVFEPFTGTVNGLIGLMLIAYLGVLWVESEQILQLKVGCPNFGPVRGLAIYPTYLR